MTFPEGPAGKSAYEVWVEAVNNGEIDWPENRTDINNFFLYLKGEDGQNGKSAYEIWLEEVEKGLDDPHNPGQKWPADETELNDFWYYLTGADRQNGVTPNIGENGNWWVGGKDTGVPAQGEDGNNGLTPNIGQNGNWWIGDEDTGVPAQGEDGNNGLTPNIGQNGNWWIGDEDTGVPAQGEDGKNGLTPNIGQNGNWWIGGKDTGIPAQGEDGNEGTPGDNGLSAYELWKIEVANGTAIKNDKPWSEDRTSISDFWEFLRGEDGKDGNDGDDGETVIVEGRFNVIAYRTNLENKEYVNWPDGTLTFKVYDKQQHAAAQGTKVIINGLVGAENKEFTVGEDGLINIPKQYLPEADVTTTAQVKTPDMTAFEETPKNTLVSARIDTKIVLQEVGDLKSGITSPLQLSLMDRNGTTVPCLNIYFKVLRKVGKDGEWEAIPDYVGATTKDVYLYTYDDENATIDENAQGEKLPAPNRSIIDISDWSTCLTQIQRKVIATGENKIDADKIPATDIWENGTKDSKRYVTIGMDNCYGDNPKIEARIQMRPAQYAPLLKSMTQIGDETSLPGGQKMVYLKGTFDTDMVEESLCFVQNYTKQETTTGNIDTYVPVNMTDEDFKSNELLQVSFTKDKDNVVADAVTMESGKESMFKIDNVWLQSMVSIKVLFGSGRISQSINFYPLNQFGVIEKDGSDQTKVKYRTYSNDKHPVSSNYTLTVSKEDKEDEKSIK